MLYAWKKPPKSAKMVPVRIVSAAKAAPSALSDHDGTPAVAAGIPSGDAQRGDGGSPTAGAWLVYDRADTSDAVFAYGAPVDLRKGFNGLSGLVEQEMKHRLLDGDVYLFLGRNPRTGEGAVLRRHRIVPIGEAAGDGAVRAAMAALRVALCLVTDVE